MSDTPRTDALDEASVGFSDEQTVKAYKKLARELERDLATAREELESKAWEISPAMAQAQIDELNRQLVAAREELARLTAIARTTASFQAKEKT